MGTNHNGNLDHNLPDKHTENLTPNSNDNNNKKRSNSKNTGTNILILIMLFLLIFLCSNYYVKVKYQSWNRLFQSIQKNKENNSQVPEKNISKIPADDTTEGNNINQVRKTDKPDSVHIDKNANTEESSDGIVDSNQEDQSDINNKQEADQKDSLDNNEKESTDSREEGRTAVKVKGIYVTGPMAGTKHSMQDLIDLTDQTEVNTMVIDIKNDSGEITYDMDIPEVKEIGSDTHYISDIKGLISKLKEKDIYLIARIVAFKDPILAKAKPELSIKNKDGTIFKDADGLSWVNPYKKEVWDYLLSVANEAADLGFDEIQFDYIRFSTDSAMKNADFGREAEDKSKVDAITEFTKYVSENLKLKGVYVSADVYGTIIDSKTDSAIVGQDYVKMAEYLDYICPMIYPSHYANGVYGISHPDLEPYNLILKALNKSKTVLNSTGNKVSTTDHINSEAASTTDNSNSEAAGTDKTAPVINDSSNDEEAYNTKGSDAQDESLDKSDDLVAASEDNTHKAIVRPWLQDFTASWLENHKTYGADEIRAQIKAVYDAGYDEWILWNGRNQYTKGGLLEE
jgi:hypothetical protein